MRGREHRGLHDAVEALATVKADVADADVVETRDLDPRHQRTDALDVAHQRAARNADADLQSPWRPADRAH